MALLACVEDRSAPASTLVTRLPAEQPLKLRPEQEGVLVVQALNDDTYAVDDVQILFLELDDSRFELLDAQDSGPLVRTTGFDAETGLRGAARLRFRVKPDAPYGVAQLAASLVRPEQPGEPDASPPSNLTQVTVEVVPDISKVQLTPFPAEPVVFKVGETEAQSVYVQAVDDQSRPINNLDIYAEVFGGVDSPVALMEKDAAQPRSTRTTTANIVMGMVTDGVVWWEVRLKGAVTTPTTAQVRFGLVGSGGTGSASRIGKFDIQILPAEEPTP
ncbi:hypothetical protein [Myxococcus sp. SDU36]|uniref:hypothetical protein n=1 Tax=Myxococcus sp. SDU36 TaxID=2831967 RepID=UPI0025428B36|nr:hypothetical protein [Myxococcus sp. SDU36]WIG93077.1 hypothetical protein KGD87_20945 [Myxococcus sp. SDU36]